MNDRQRDEWLATITHIVKTGGYVRQPSAPGKVSSPGAGSILSGVSQFFADKLQHHGPDGRSVVECGRWIGPAISALRGNKIHRQGSCVAIRCEASPKIVTAAHKVENALSTSEIPKRFIFPRFGSHSDEIRPLKHPELKRLLRRW